MTENIHHPCAGLKNPGTVGRLLLAAIMVVALLSYLTITTTASKSAGAGIYELEVSNLALATLLASEPAQLKQSPARTRHRRAVIQ